MPSLLDLLSSPDSAACAMAATSRPHLLLMAVLVEVVDAHARIIRSGRR